MRCACLKELTMRFHHILRFSLLLAASAFITPQVAAQDSDLASTSSFTYQGEVKRADVVVNGTASSTGVGTIGYATATNGQAIGVQGQSDSPQGRGVFGWATAATGETYGVWGRSDSTDGIGVSGHATLTSGATTGVLGRSDAADDSAAGVYALAAATSRITTGVWGIVQSNADGAAAVYGLTTQQSGFIIGCFGATDSADGYGVFAHGDMGTDGTKQFVIDHPLDPANKLLHHYSTEGPEPYNTYRGNVTLNSSGEADVALPPYFAAINTDPTYQLTAIGKPAPALHVAEEIADNHFRIAGGAPGQRISWMVTARRNDPYVKAHPAHAETEKSPEMKGRYLQPRLFGVPSSQGLRPYTPRQTPQN